MRTKQDLSWWKNQKVAIWGCARSGIAAANLLAELGIKSIISDQKTEVDLKNLDPSVEIRLGENVLENASILIPSPALKPSDPKIIQAQKQGLMLMSEIELGAHFTKASMIGITGTDGKSTTTALCAHLLKEGFGIESKAVGNIGDAFCQYVLDAKAEDIFSVEISAFQLWSTSYFPAKVGILTNIAEDHYDYFEYTPSKYKQAKMRLFDLVSPGGLAVWNDYDDRLKDQDCPQHLKLERIGLKTTSHWHCRSDGYYHHDEKIFDLDASPLVGVHHQRNVLAAMATLHHLGLEPKEAQKALATFEALPYRMQKIRVLDGVTWVNDSKATNVHAACAGLLGVSDPLVVIAGGYDKQLDLKPFVEILAKKAKSVLLIGQTAQVLFDALSEAQVSAEIVGSLDRAIQRARLLAKAGDMVIFSPAASSFDQFRDYVERGESFNQMVRALSFHQN
jgi:UDP-N-acetylmuramoylalanine--D-glutamate ligase